VACSSCRFRCGAIATLAIGLRRGSDCAAAVGNHFGCAGAAGPARCAGAFLLAYLCGVLCTRNCYWGSRRACSNTATCLTGANAVAGGLHLVLGLYFGLFRPGRRAGRRASGNTRLALAAAPIFWAGLELAAARITSVPWDQLGYSQVDNGLVNQLAP